MNAEDNTAKQKEALAKLLGSDEEALVRQGFELLASLENPTLVQAVVDESLLTPYLKTLFPEVIDPWEAMGPPEELKAEAWGDERLGRLLKSDNLSTDNEQGAGNWRELALLQMDCFFVVVVREGVLEYSDADITGSHRLEVYLSKEDAEESYQSWFDDLLTLENEEPFLDQPHMAPTWMRDTLKNMECAKATSATMETLERVAEVADRVAGDWESWNSSAWSDATFAGQEEAYYGPRSFYSRADFAGLDLTGVDFSRAHLVGADLSNCRLGAAQFSRANLCGADLSGSDLTDADFGKDSASVSQCAWYDATTRWPEGFEPSAQPGLRVIDWAFYRQARALQTEMFLAQDSWDWNEVWQTRLLACVGLSLPESGPVALPTPMANAYEAASFYFNENLAERGQIVADEQLTLGSPVLPDFPPLAERLDLEDLQADRESWSRTMNPLEHVVWLLPDAIVHDVSSYNDCVTDRGDWLQECSALLQVGSEWLVMGLTVSFSGYCDQNFDGYGALSFEIHDSREAAIDHLKQKLWAERNIRLADDILFWNHGVRMQTWAWCDRLVAPEGVLWRSETLRQDLMRHGQSVAEDYRQLGKDLRAFVQSLSAKIPR